MTAARYTQDEGLILLAGMKGLLAKDSMHKMRIHCGEGEFGIVAGQGRCHQCPFTTLPALDTDGPKLPCRRTPGEWLPTCLQHFDDGEARLHMGDDTLTIFEQQNIFTRYD